MSTGRGREIYVLAVTEAIEKGVKECIDDISTPPHSTMLHSFKAHRRLHSYLHYARQIIPNWNIKAELRESRLVVKPLVNIFRDCLEKLDTSDPRVTEVISYNRMHQALVRIREKDPTWSINGSIRYGTLISQLRHPQT
jgi:hypothetical protein